MLEACGLVKTYRKRRVVDRVSLQVSPGSIVGLLGPNGAGKTTTFYMIVGLVRPDGGTVRVDGVDISPLPVYRRARLGIGYLSQEPSVFRRMSVLENILAVLELLPANSKGAKLSRKEREAKAHALLVDMGLQDVASQRAYTLSGGERRRVEIARALATEPRYLLLDEPFSGIDPIAVSDLQGIVAGLKQKGLGILITDHNVRETLAVTDFAYIMYEGRIMRSGSAKELAEDPEARRLYLGEAFRL